jgi:hypothetical protein
MSPSPIRLDDAWSRLLARVNAVIVAMLARALPPALAAGEGLVTRAERRAIVAWLRPLESVVRALIFIQTLPLAPAPDRASGRWREPGGLRPDSANRAAPPAPAFSLGFIGLGGGGGGRGGPRLHPSRDELVPLQPLVARLEAALAVIEDPAPHVVRAARRFGLAPPGIAVGCAPADGARRAGFGPVARAALIPEIDAILAPPDALDTS